MSKMIERVARAICCPDGCDGDTGSGNPCNIAREDRTSISQARAALEAMREPTETMLNAARDWSRAKYGIPVGNDGASGCWQSMIDAAMERIETP